MARKTIAQLEEEFAITAERIDALTERIDALVKLATATDTKPEKAERPKKAERAERASLPYADKFPTWSEVDKFRKENEKPGKCNGFVYTSHREYMADKPRKVMLCQHDTPCKYHTENEKTRHGKRVNNHKEWTGK